MFGFYSFVEAQCFVSRAVKSKKKYGDGTSAGDARRCVSTDVIGVENGRQWLYGRLRRSGGPSLQEFKILTEHFFPAEFVVVAAGEAVGFVAEVLEDVECG